MLTKRQLRNNFIAYNKARYLDFTNNYSSKQRRLINLLPLLLHTNLNLMPGYISKHTPHGIADYTADKQSLHDAGKLNAQFAAYQNIPLEQPPIEAIFIQQCILTGEVIFWVIHDSQLDSQQVDLLDKKTASIIRWLASFDIKMSYIVSDAASISYQYYSFKKYKFHIDKCFFLDNFYAESLLVAGKIPAWWLYISEPEAQQDRQVIYCGNLVTPRPNDYMSAAIWHLYNIFRQPETSWINLAIIDQFIISRIHRFFSVDLRDMVHNSDNMPAEDIHHDYSVYLKDTIDIKQTSIDYSLLNRFHTTYRTTGHKTVFDYLTSASRQQDKSQTEMDFIKYMEVIASLLKRSERLFRRIKTLLNLTFDSSSMSYELNNITNGLLSRLVDTDRKIAFINPSPAFMLERVHFRQNADADQHSWSLLVGDQRSDTEIRSANNLIHLLCWAFVNQLIDASTQVSIQCMDFSIRQIDILNILKTLQQCVDISDFTDIDIDKYIDTPQPTKSILFIGHTSDNFHEQIIEHLVIYNSGEVFIHSYRGLHVFYNWFESNPRQAVHVRLYGNRANNFRSLNQKILSRFSTVAIY